MIFGILGKFCIDIGVQKKIHRKFFRRKNIKLFSKFFDRKKSVEKKLVDFFSGRFFTFSTDFSSDLLCTLAQNGLEQAVLPAGALAEGGCG